MSKVTLSQAAEHFGVSKEAIHNRVRRGSLEVVVENGVKMIVIDPSKQAPKPRQTTSKKSILNNDRYYKLLEEQNTKLQSRVDVLETETRSLRDQKELMLIEERKKIERIYKEKDEQLKSILSTLSSQFMLSVPDTQTPDMLEAEIEVEENITHISLKKHLKKLELSEKKIKKIKVRFDKKAKKDDRIITIGSKYYIDTSKYNYDDLIK